LVHGEVNEKGDFGVKHRNAFFLVAVSVMLVFAPQTDADVEWNVQKTFKLEKAPLDVAVSNSGRWVFVLTEKGRVLIYGTDGTLKDSITVGSQVDGIAAGPKEDVLFLSSRKGATIQEIILDFIYDIDTASAPASGPANAPVIVSVFNDFQ
jgi:hypothetical protein